MGLADRNSVVVVSSIAAPDADEAIKWGSPVLSYKRVRFTFTTFKHQITPLPEGNGNQYSANKISDYKHSKVVIPLILDQPLPLSLIEWMAAFRVRDLLENDAKWMWGRRLSGQPYRCVTWEKRSPER